MHKHITIWVDIPLSLLIKLWIIYQKNWFYFDYYFNITFLNRLVDYLTSIIYFLIFNIYIFQL